MNSHPLTQQIFIISSMVAGLYLESFGFILGRTKSSYSYSGGTDLFFRMGHASWKASKNERPPEAEVEYV